MNRERLLKLIAAVEARPEERLDMLSWSEPGTCGTVCCAVGSYCEAHPEAELGLMSDGGSSLFPFLRQPPNIMGIRAVAKHFDISVNAADRLFVVFHYVDQSKPAVLARLREFMGGEAVGAEGSAR